MTDPNIAQMWAIWFVMAFVGFIIGTALGIMVFSKKAERALLVSERRYRDLEQKYNAALEIIEVKSRPSKE